MKVANLAFYQFVHLEAPREVADALETLCRHLEMRGTVLVSAEGINAMLAGSLEAASNVEAFLRADPRFQDTPVKISYSDEVPFQRLKVKVKKEIVTMRTDGVRAYDRTAPHLPPAQLRDWLRDGEDVVLIDTRNEFEVEIGTFEGAINPRTKSFGEFPEWVESHREELEGRKVVMFCTGGIRCEKATSWMLEAGFDDLHQLDGGVLNYFAEVPDADKDWKGELFVFDDRITVDTKLRSGRSE